MLVTSKRLLGNAVNPVRSSQFNWIKRKKWTKKEGVIVYKTYFAIHWIDICPMDSRLSNKQDQHGAIFFYFSGNKQRRILYEQLKAKNWLVRNLPLIFDEIF